MSDADPTTTTWTPAQDELGAVLRDCMAVTERLQRTHESLEREVLRLRRELESKDRELEIRRRLASLGELAAGVAHEVRNPLGAIRLYSGLLRSECGALRPALELIDKIEAGIRAIDGVVRDTLALAPRATALARVPLRRVVERARDLAQGVLERRGVRLEIEYQDPHVAVLADDQALPRVLLNLIANAAEASAADGRVRLRAERECDGEVSVRVLDDGPGIPPAALERIFDPFFTTKEHGTGLGLTLAHRLVEAHGGRLLAGNRPEGGAEFIVTLPTGSAGGRQPESKGADGEVVAA